MDSLGRRDLHPRGFCGVVQGWLFGKAIYGGSAEVQNNIVSTRIRGLPDTTQST